MFETILRKEQEKPYMKTLLTFLENEAKSKTIFPKKSEWFLSLELCPFDNIKVVVLGQDPYHDKDQAHGLAFSVLNQRLPKSLINIFKELKSDLGIERTNGNLSDWAKQGVLLLNTILTVEAHKPLSHQHKGWETFTLEIIKAINQIKRPIVFILMGNHARKYRSLLNNFCHLIIEAAHPSPLSAYRGFFGSKIFSTTNNYLINQNIQPIKW